MGKASDGIGVCEETWGNNLTISGNINSPSWDFGLSRQPRTEVINVGSDMKHESMDDYEVDRNYATVVHTVRTYNNENYFYL